MQITQNAAKHYWVFVDHQYREGEAQWRCRTCTNIPQSFSAAVRMPILVELVLFNYNHDHALLHIRISRLQSLSRRVPCNVGTVSSTRCTIWTLLIPRTLCGDPQLQFYHLRSQVPPPHLRHHTGGTPSIQSWVALKEATRHTRKR